MKKTVFAFGWLRPKRCPREKGGVWLTPKDKAEPAPASPHRIGRKPFC